MSAQQRVVLFFYSDGPHFMKALQAVRRAYPEAHLVAVTPEGLSAQPDVAQLADAVAVRPGMRRLVPWLRGYRAEAMAVMFASPKLRVLAALSGARAVWHARPDGKLKALPRTLWANTAVVVREKAYGHVLYGTLWWYIRLRPVRRIHE